MLSLGLLLAVCLALLHLFASTLKGPSWLPQRHWISLAGGISIAYIFLDVFPELAHAQEKIEHVGGWVEYLERHVYILALLGLALFCGLDKWALRSRAHNQTMSEADHTTIGVFWIHIAAFAIHNGILGYLFQGASHFCRYMKMLDGNIRVLGYSRSVFAKVGCSPCSTNQQTMA
jgi:hypothetical protein